MNERGCWDDWGYLEDSENFGFGKIVCWVYYDIENITIKSGNAIQIRLSMKHDFISATKDGIQMSGIAKMIERIAGVEMS